MKLEMTGANAALCVGGLLVAGGLGYAFLSQTQATRVEGELSKSLPDTVIQKKASLRPAALFADNMILQQKAPIRVWGVATSGEKITVAFEGQSGSTIAKGGEWTVTLPPAQRPAGGPYKLTITGTKSYTFKNVMLGEVWLCASPSDAPLSAGQNAAGGAAGAGSPNVRLFSLKGTQSDKMQTRFGAEGKGWQTVGGKEAGLGGVAYYFGRELQKARRVPVGIIQIGLGGTRADQWIPEATLSGDPNLKPVVEEYAVALSDFQKASDGFRAAQAKAKDEHKPAPLAPAAPRQFSVCYNGMIAPLKRLPLAGVIWYQGEADGSDPARDKVFLPAIVKSWRETWNSPRLPFIVAQSPRSGFGNANALATNTGFVLTDGGEKDLQPKQKEATGGRLALQARKVAYGETVAADVSQMR